MNDLVRGRFHRFSIDALVDTEAEPSGELALAELGREDSNLQLPKSRGRRAAHRPKARKKLTDARDAKQAPPERKPDPETVTKPSSGSAPRRRT